jgi:enoyl-CoA hydratase
MTTPSTVTAPTGGPTSSPLAALLGTRYRTVLLEHTGTALTVTVNRPNALNALNQVVLGELADVLTAVRAVPRREVAGLILTGAGEKAFVAGADIAEMRGMTPAQAEAFAALGQRVPDLAEALDRPVIACVAGYALGGGCELALGCDFVYATEQASFGQPEVKLGLIPCFGGCLRLQRLIGPGRARELSYTGRMIPARQAAEWGLVNRLFADRTAMLAAARETVDEIAGRGLEAVAVTKQVISASALAASAVGLAAERAGFARVMGGHDAREGTTAFLEKRPARFTDC